MIDLQDMLLLEGPERAQAMERQLAAAILDISADDWLRGTPLAQALFSRAKALATRREKE